MVKVRWIGLVTIRWLNNIQISIIPEGALKAPFLLFVQNLKDMDSQRNYSSICKFVQVLYIVFV